MPKCDFPPDSLCLRGFVRAQTIPGFRIKDVDLDRGTVTVRQGKGDKDRMSVLPRSLRSQVAAQIERAREVWTWDQTAGLAGVYLPGGLDDREERPSPKAPPRAETSRRTGEPRCAVPAVA